MPARATAVAFALAGSLTSCAGLAERGQPVTPQRPTFSSDTNTTAEGTIELETGGSADRNGSLTTPTTVKFGAGPRTELFAGTSPINVVDRPGDEGVGFGDVLLGTRHRFWESDDGLSAAVQLSGKLPTASTSEGLGSGEPDVFLAAILTTQVGAATALTGYYEYGALGDPAGGGSEDQHGFALAGSHGLDERWGLFAELASVHSSGTDNTFTTLGASHAYTPSLAFDAGVAIGLSDDADDLRFQLGMTWNFGGPGD